MDNNEITHKPEQKKPLGLCLSGGGAIGFAHIGVLQALTDNGIEAQAIAGSSMGAIVGTLYAAGYTPKEMMRMIKEDRLYLVSKLMTFKPTFWKSGFSSHSTVQKLIKECIPHDSFENLPRKLFICVTNMNTMQWEIKEKGKQLASWVSASASIPGVFEALVKNGVYYLDGGVLNNMPAQALKDICRSIIGVDVIPFQVPCGMKHPIDAITCTLRGVEHNNSLEGRSLCQHIIEPKALRKYHEFRFDAYRKIYNLGYKDAMDYIEKHPEIKQL